MPWLAHLFHVRPWEVRLLEADDLDELLHLVDRWIENGAQWATPRDPTRVT